MKRKMIYAAVALMTFAGCNSNERPTPELIITLADFPELEHIKNVQGAAVCGDLLFSLQDQGWCNVLDLRTGKPVSQFPLASQGRNNHANVAFFGSARYDSSDRFPLLYVSQCKSQPVTEIGLAETDSLSRLLFVERIITDDQGIPGGSELVQIITFEPKQWNSRLWFADSRNPQDLWCYGNIVGNEKPGNRIVMQRFDFPEFSADRFLLELTEEDILEETYFDALMPEGHRGPQNAILQGAFLLDGVVFMPCGTGSEKHPNELFYAKLDGSKYGWFDYTDIMPVEPEDMDIWGDRIICPCNTDSTGVVYSFPYRKLIKAML